MVGNVGAWVRRQRQAHGWSQADLAREAGISQQQISNLENGITDTVTWRMITGLARAFMLSERDLLVATGLIPASDSTAPPPHWVRELVRYGQDLSPAQRCILVNLAHSLAEDRATYQAEPDSLSDDNVPET